MNVLITAFGPFPGVDVNDSEKLLSRFQGEVPPLPSLVITKEVLDTTYSGAVKAAKRIHSQDYDLVIHMGVYPGIPHIYAESTAENMASMAAPDAAGKTWNGNKVVTDGPEVLHSSLPLNAIVQKVREFGLPIVVYRSMTCYVCNFLYYNSLYQAMVQGSDAGVVFLHIPSFDQEGGSTSDDFLRTLWMFLKYAISLG